MTDLESLRQGWRYRGDARPDLATAPGPGQESVWDYPRPPAYVADDRRVEIWAGDRLIAASQQAIRALETGSPPAFYLPAGAFDRQWLRPSAHQSFCEWKGQANYYDVVTPTLDLKAAVWCYADPLAGAEAIAGYLSVYPESLQCFVGGEAVVPQRGEYYGGWVTSELVGPWKGEPGTSHW